MMDVFGFIFLNETEHLRCIFLGSCTNTVKLPSKIYVQIISNSMVYLSDGNFIRGITHLCNMKYTVKLTISWHRLRTLTSMNFEFLSRDKNVSLSSGGVGKFCGVLNFSKALANPPSVDVEDSSVLIPSLKKTRCEVNMYAELLRRLVRITFRLTLLKMHNILAGIKSILADE